MENFLLIVISGVLALYFFSSTSIYKSLYRKVSEEKDILNEEVDKLKNLLKRYEKQVKLGANTLKGNQETLQVARDDLQDLKLQNMNLRKKIDELEKINEELYAQVNAMV